MLVSILESLSTLVDFFQQMPNQESLWEQLTLPILAVELQRPIAHRVRKEEMTKVAFIVTNTSRRCDPVMSRWKTSRTMAVWRNVK